MGRDSRSRSGGRRDRSRSGGRDKSMSGRRQDRSRSRSRGGGRDRSASRSPERAPQAPQEKVQIQLTNEDAAFILGNLKISDLTAVDYWAFCFFWAAWCSFTTTFFSTLSCATIYCARPCSTALC